MLGMCNRLSRGSIPTDEESRNLGFKSDTWIKTMFCIESDTFMTPPRLVRQHSIPISDISLMPNTLVSTTEYTGTYLVLYISQETVCLINRSCSFGTFIDCHFQVSRSVGSCVYFYIGYSADHSFGILKLLRWNTEHSLRPGDVDVQQILTPVPEESYRLDHCATQDVVTKNWRVLRIC
jgi:hypothetical protein